MKIKDFFKRIYDLRLIKTKIQPQKNSSHLNRYSSAFERGRSMIEMLGVLVIMGLLAVGGIWGYQYAMNTYRAGQIQDVMAQAKALTVSRRTASEEALLTFLDKTAVAGFNPTVGIAETADANGRIQRVYSITLDLLNEGIQPILYARKPNFAKMDIMLAPSADAVEETDQSKESWVDAGMSEGGYDILQQYATLQSSSTAMFSFTTHLRGHMASDGSGDDPSTKCPADKPFYDDAVDSCSQCDPTQHSYWDPVQATCVTCSGEKSEWDYVLYSCICPSSKPVWDEGTGTCVACLSNGNCSGSTPFCNPDTNSCEGCPSNAPVWDSGSGNCVGCLTGSDCNGATPVCNPTTNECVGCPSATPVWDSSIGACVECTADSHCADNTDGRTKCNTTEKICEMEAFCPNAESYKFATEEAAQECAENCPDHFAKNTYCYKCSGSTSVSYSTPELAQSECADKCLGERYVYNKSCRSCNSTSVYVNYSTEAEAQACAKSCQGKLVATGKYCHYCPSETSSTIVFNSQEEALNCATSCKAFGYNTTAVGRYCLSCDTSGGSAFGANSSQSASAEECAQKCPNRIAIVDSLDVPLCVNCEGLGWQLTSESAAKSCADQCNSMDSNNKAFYGDNVCYTCSGFDSSSTYALTFKTTAAAKKCTENCPGTVSTGTYCYKCEYSASLTFSTEAEAQECASTCANRIAVGKNCMPCSSVSKDTVMTAAEAENCAEKCSNTFSDGSRCYSCDYQYSYNLGSTELAEACAKACPNRYVNSGTYCNLCKSIKTSYATEAEAQECASKCSDRKAQGKECFTCDYDAEIVFDTEAEAKACAAQCPGQRQANGRSCNRIYKNEADS